MSAPQAHGSGEAEVFNDPSQRTVAEVQTLLQKAERNIVNRFENGATPRPQLAQALRGNNRAAETLLNNAFGQSPQDILEDAVRKEASLLQEWNLTRFGTGDWDSEEGLHDVFYDRKNFPLRHAASDAGYTVARREMLQYSWYGLPPLEFEIVRNHYNQRELGNPETGERPGLHLREALRAMGLTWPAPALASAVAPAPTSAVAPAPTSTVPPAPGTTHARNQRRAQGTIQRTRPTNAPGPDSQARAMGYTHEGLKNAPSPNVPMPQENLPAQPVNFTIAEIMTFFPQTVRSGDMNTRISWNGGNPAKVTNMYLSHRLEGQNTRPKLRNSILKIFGTSLRIGTETVSGWKHENYGRDKEANMPGTHHRDSLSMAGIRTFAEFNPHYGRKDKYPATGLSFSSLVSGVKHLPTGSDALDLTRCVDYVIKNWATCSTLFFPDDYFQLLAAVGGPLQPTNQHHDRAAFQRWDHERTDVTWKEECKNFMDLIERLRSLYIPAQNRVLNLTPSSNVVPPQPPIQHQAQNPLTPPNVPNPIPGLQAPQQNPWVQQPDMQNQSQYPVVPPGPPGLLPGPNALPHQHPSIPQASQYGYPQMNPYGDQHLFQNDYQQPLYNRSQHPPQNRYQSTLHTPSAAGNTNAGIIDPDLDPYFQDLEGYRITEENTADFHAGSINEEISRILDEFTKNAEERTMTQDERNMYFGPGNE